MPAFTMRRRRPNSAFHARHSTRAAPTGLAATLGDKAVTVTLTDSAISGYAIVRPGR